MVQGEGAAVDQLLGPVAGWLHPTPYQHWGLMSNTCSIGDRGLQLDGKTTKNFSFPPFFCSLFSVSFLLGYSVSLNGTL